MGVLEKIKKQTKETVKDFVRNEKQVEEKDEKVRKEIEASFKNGMGKGLKMDKKGTS